MSKRVDLDSVTTYTYGRLQLIVGLCEKIGLQKFSTTVSIAIRADIVTFLQGSKLR